MMQGVEVELETLETKPQGSNQHNLTIYKLLKSWGWKIKWEMISFVDEMKLCFLFNLVAHLFNFLIPNWYRNWDKLNHFPFFLFFSFYFSFYLLFGNWTSILDLFNVRAILLMKKKDSAKFGNLGLFM